MSATQEEKKSITCSITGKSVAAETAADGSLKLPRGWRRRGELVYSPDGFKQSYIRRCLMIPVSSVVREEISDDTNAGWKSLWDSLSRAWGDATRYANLCLAHFAAKNFSVPLENTDKGLRLPKIEREVQNAWRREVYGLHHSFPAISATSAAAISLEAWETCRKSAWEIRVTGQKSLPTFRYPMPIPLTAQSCRWSMDDGNGWVLLRTLINGSAFNLRFSSRHNGHHKYRRQIESLRAALAVPGSIGEVSLLRRRRFGSGGESNEKGGWQIWAAISVSLEKQPRGQLDPERSLSVKLGDGSLFTAIVDGQERIWALHADDFIPRLARYDEARLRRADDQKFERRRGKDRQRYVKMIGDRATKHRNWLDVQLHRRSRELVEFCRRQRCGRLEMKIEKPPTGIPMFKLIEKIKQKSDEYGIVVRVIDGAETSASAPVVK